MSRFPRRPVTVLAFVAAAVVVEMLSISGVVRFPAPTSLFWVTLWPSMLALALGALALGRYFDRRIETGSPVPEQTK
jgi:hypothetical protein